MFGYRRVCTSVASAACVASLSGMGTHAFAMSSPAIQHPGICVGRFAKGRLDSIPTRRTCRPTSPRSASETASTPNEDRAASPFLLLQGETLISVRRCIDAVDQERRGRQTKRRPQKEPSPKIVFVDGSWYHKPDPATGLHRNPDQEYIAGPRLPNALYLDIDAVAATRELFPDQNPKGLAHMMPPPKLFALAMDAYNIRNEDHIIIYARRGALFTPRVWFLFVSMGHDPKNVHLMQGSMEDYMEAGGPVETNSLLAEEDKRNNGDDQYHATMGERFIDCFDHGILNVTRLHQAHYSTTTPQYNNLDISSAMNICGKEEVLDVVNHYLERYDKDSKRDKDSERRSVIIDTRGSGYALKGYMPSAIHIPYTQIATPNNPLVIRPKLELKDLFDEHRIDYLDSELKVILSCGSGVSVCHGYLALKELGRNITEENTRIYDGSWKEWGKEDNLPKILPKK